MTANSYTEFAVVEQGWEQSVDGPPLWDWGTREEADALQRALPGGPWLIVSREVTVSDPQFVTS